MNDDRVFEIRISRVHADSVEKQMAKWNGPTIVDLFTEEILSWGETMHDMEGLEFEVKEVIENKAAEAL